MASRLPSVLPVIFLSSTFFVSPAFAESEAELFFEAPADGTLVSRRDPALRLRLHNVQGSGVGLEALKIDVDGQASASCTLDLEAGVAHCLLAEALQDGWQTINASLLDGETVLAQAVVSIAVDSDEDRVPNHEDSCANTPLQESVDNVGCALSQLDTDGDGISDGEEVAAGSNPADAASFPQIEIRAFSALPQQIARVGDSAGLSWSIQGASSVTLINDADETRLTELSSVGTAQVSPRINTSYTLTAEGPGGSTSALIQVAIASPQPENRWGPSPIEQVPEAISASLTVAGDGAVYLGAFDGNYYRFSPNGSLDWTLENIGIAMNQAAITNGQVFVGTNSADGGRILAINADKSLLWEVHTPSGIVASPLLNADASLLYAAGYDGTILGLSTVDGSEQWRYELPEGETVSASPTINKDGTTLYVHSNNHQVFALSTALVMLKSLGDSQITPLIWQSDIRPGSEN